MTTQTSSLSWYPVPEDVKRLLKLSIDYWEDTVVSEQYMTQALAKAGDNPDVLVAAYRYFFYRNNCPMALEVAERVIAQIRKLEQLPEDWTQLQPILIERKEEPLIRLYLNAYAALGLVLAKLGAIEQAKEITARVSQIDDKKEFGAATVLDVLTHPGDEDE